jgi:hypothetical protein
MTPGWTWGTIAAQVAAAGTQAQRNDILTKIHDAYAASTVTNPAGPATTSPEDSTDRYLRSEELVVLRRLSVIMAGSMPTDLADRVTELEAIDGKGPDAPVTYEEVIEQVTEHEVGSGLNDGEWTDLVDQFTPGPGGALTRPALAGPGLDEVVLGLAREAKKDPVRFARLIASFGPDVPSRIVDSGIGGIADSGTLLDNATDAALLLIRSVITRPPDTGTDRALLRLIYRLANTDLPTDVVVTVPTIFVRNPKPQQWMSADLVMAGLNHPRGAAVATAAELLRRTETRPARLPQLIGLLAEVANDDSPQVRIFLPDALTRIYDDDPDRAGTLADIWLANATDPELAATNLDRLTWQLATTRSTTAMLLLDRMITSSEPDVRRRAGQLAALFDIHEVSLPPLTVEPLTLALTDQAARHGIADSVVQLIKDLPQATGTGQTGHRLSHATLIDLANDASTEISSEIMELGKYIGAPLVDYDALLAALADTEAFKRDPGTLFHFLSQRLDELPPAVLKLCRRWAEQSAAAAANIANSEAADAYDVTEVILGLYAHAQPGSATRNECLDVIDLLVEHNLGDIDQKSDNAVYEPSR